MATSSLRHPPTQARSRDRLRRLLDAADALLREAFLRDRTGDRALLSESALMLSAYLTARLGPPGP